MKLNKAFITAALALGTLMAGGLASQAQDNTNTPPAGAPPGGMNRPGFSFDAISQRLELTDDQKPKVKPIIQDMLKQMADYRKDNPDATMADRRAKMKEIRDGVTDKLKDILTADQLTKWQQMGSRRPNGAGGPPPAVTPSTNAPADAPKN